MVDAHQDAILAAKDEQKAILELVENGMQDNLMLQRLLIRNRKQ